MKHRIILFLFVLLSPHFVSSQDQIGMKLSNMMPTQMARLNPSAIVDQKPYRDIELFGVSAYAHNDYIFLDKSELSVVRWQWPEGGTEDFNFQEKNAFSEINVFLPSFSIASGKISYGLRTGIRTYLIGDNIPWHAAKFGQEGLNYGPLQNQRFNSDAFKIGLASWMQIGGHVGTVVYQRNRNYVTAGAYVSRLIGITAMGFNVNSTNYRVLGDETVDLLNISAETGVTAPGFNTGNGWGVDLGFTFQRKVDDAKGYVPHSKQSECRYFDYRWKFGMSILDIGSINYSVNSFYRGFDNVIARYGDMENESPSDVNEVGDIVDNGVIAGNVTEAASYSMRLPLSINAQFDYNFLNGYKVGAIGNFVVPGLGSMGVDRLHYVGIIPRYESYLYELAAPISVNSFMQPRVGVMFRIGPLTVGTDNFLPLLFEYDAYELQAYFTLRLLRFNSPTCRPKDIKWRVGDCSGPSILPRSSKVKRKANKSRFKRNMKRQKRYLK